MRCLIKTVRAAAGWTVSYSDPVTHASLAPDRQLALCTQKQRFPLPSNHQAEECDPATHALCADPTGQATKSLFDAINRLDVDAKDVRTFGRYLTRVLLGDNWATLQAAAGAGAAGRAAPAIELELAFPDDSSLASLPWEIMHDAGGPLGAQHARVIALTRIVDPATRIGDIPPVKLPLRVLFIVGSQINDQLRPGAELIGLLRRMQIPIDPLANTFETADLNVRYLSEATWDEIETAVGQFLPTVVHIVSHGTAGDRPRLLLTKRKVDADPNSEKLLHDPYQCSADRLVELLDHAGSLPPVVIVNACHTADQAHAPIATRAFAEELVHRGVAMAVGMSGEVADRACQLFTLRFYHSLLQRGLSVSLAAAQGRRAALLGFEDYLESMEWAKPALFLARGVSPILDITPSSQDVCAIAGRFRTLRNPEALCDRYEFLERYEQRTRSGPGRAGAAPVMAIASKESGLGKSRLLQEIAARSVLDKFAPVVVGTQKGSVPPCDALEFALQIGEATQETRKHFGLEPRRLTRAEVLGFRLAKMNPEPVDRGALAVQRIEFRRNFRNRPAAPEARLVDKLADVVGTVQLDCEELKQDINAQLGELYQVFIVLDDLHRYANLAREIVDTAGAFGLGSAALPLPLLFSYSATDTEGKALEEHLSARRDFLQETLSAIENEQDQKLAFSQLVLSSWKLAVNRHPAMAEAVNFFFLDMRDWTGGCPGQFLSPSVEAAVKAHHRYKTLVSANFDLVLRQWN